MTYPRKVGVIGRKKREKNKKPPAACSKVKISPRSLFLLLQKTIPKYSLLYSTQGGIKERQGEKKNLLFVLVRAHNNSAAAATITTNSDFGLESFPRACGTEPKMRNVKKDQQTG